MVASVPADLEQFVRQEVASGRYPDRDAVIAQALRVLQRDREEALQGVLAGLDDAAAGRMQPLGEAFADLRRELKIADDA